MVKLIVILYFSKDIDTTKQANNQDKELIVLQFIMNKNVIFN